MEEYLWWKLKTHQFPGEMNMSRNGDTMQMTLLPMLKKHLLVIY